VWVTAQAGRDPENGELVPGGLEGQLERAISNLEAILDDCGSSLDRVIKTMVMVVGDPSETLIDAVFARRFPRLPALGLTNSASPVERQRPDGRPEKSPRQIPADGC